MERDRDRRPLRTGYALLWATFSLTLLCMVGALAVDGGRYVAARTELRGAADSAARYAASKLEGSATPAASALAYASEALAEMKVDGGQLLASDITVAVGTWNSSTRVFTATGTNPNAVKVDLVYSFNRAGRPNLLASAVASAQTPQLSASAVAIYARPYSETTVRGSGNPWLGGMPYNTTTTNLQGNSDRYDNSGTAGNAKQRPVEIDLEALGLKPGDTISFAGIEGTGAYKAGEDYGPDGDTDRIVSVGDSTSPPAPNNSINGIANTRAPIGSVIAVFMSDSAPTSSAAPACLDFGTAAQRNYSSYSPQLKQVIFVGDGLRSSGARQTIVIPAGATRVFVGMMDAWQWNDNTGTFDFGMYGSSAVVTVH